MRYGTSGPDSIRRSTLPPAFTLDAEAKPSMPSGYAGRALVVFQPVEPGKQFSFTTAWEDVQVRARGVACARSDWSEAPASDTARTL